MGGSDPCEQAEAQVQLSHGGEVIDLCSELGEACTTAWTSWYMWRLTLVLPITSAALACRKKDN